MNAKTNKPQENKIHSVTNNYSQKQNNSNEIFQFLDNRPETQTNNKLQEMMHKSHQSRKLKTFQETVNPNQSDKNTIQLFKSARSQSEKKQAIQKQENNTGLPDNLKSGIENLSGYSMDDVKVHYNSDKPATLQAHAYAQDTDIHLASGQEKHLPHEAWHVVQQKQGRVKPTIQLQGKVNVNDDVGLEKEADVMGGKALGPISIDSISNTYGLIQRSVDPVIQCNDGMSEEVNLK